MPEFATNGLGNTLRAERLRRGLDLAEIAAETKICRNILDAIERDQFDCMPGGAYRRSFLRQYAHALGLDEAEAVAAFHQQYEEPLLPLPVPPKNTRPWRFLELAWVLATAAAFVGIYRVTESAHSIPDFKEPEVAQVRPAGEPAEVRPAPEPARLQTPAPAAAAGGSPALLRVAFAATEPVWVSVKCDGTLIYTGTLQGQEIKTFEAAGVVTALIGNAGGLAISLDGKPLGPVGPHGQIQLLELTTKGARRLPLHPGPANSAASDPEA